MQCEQCDGYLLMVLLVGLKLRLVAHDIYATRTTGQLMRAEPFIGQCKESHESLLARHVVIDASLWASVSNGFLVWKRVFFSGKWLPYGKALVICSGNIHPSFPKCNPLQTPRISATALY